MLLPFWALLVATWRSGAIAAASRVHGVPGAVEPRFVDCAACRACGSCMLDPVGSGGGVAAAGGGVGGGVLHGGPLRGREEPSGDEICGDGASESRAHNDSLFPKRQRNPRSKNATASLRSGVFAIGQWCCGWSRRLRRLSWCHSAGFRVPVLRKEHAHYA